MVPNAQFGDFPLSTNSKKFPPPSFDQLVIQAVRRRSNHFSTSPVGLWRSGYEHQKGASFRDLAKFDRRNPHPRGGIPTIKLQDRSSVLWMALPNVSTCIVWPRLQNQSVQTLLPCQSICTPGRLEAHGSRPGNTLLVQFDWRSRTKFVRAAF